MNSVADYIAAVILILIAIAIFVNIKNGTLGEWLKSKFLGIGPGGSGATTPFSSAA